MSSSLSRNSSSVVSSLSYRFFITAPFNTVRSSRRNQANDAVPLRVNHCQQERSVQHSEGFGSNLAVICTAIHGVQSRPGENGRCTAKSDAVLLDIQSVLRLVPFEFHGYALADLSNYNYNFHYFNIREIPGSRKRGAGLPPPPVPPSHIPAVFSADLEQGLGDLAEGADAHGVHQHGEDVVVPAHGLAQALEHGRRRGFMGLVEIR